MKKKISVLLGAFLVFLQTSGLHAQSFSSLHSFNANSDGQTPEGGVTLCGGLLYGVTYQGDNGSGYDSGIVYSVCTNGSNYQILYSFSGSDGQNPAGVPAVSGGWIYGTTYGGGAGNDGVIYCICTNGSNFSALHTFDDGPNGKNPEGDLLLVNGTLFGTTAYSGANEGGASGTIYSISANGSNFTVLHTFDTNEWPCLGKLALSGGTLYGMTSLGGPNNFGRLYSICTNGSNFSILHQFNAAEGSPGGSPVVSGSNVYGCSTLYSNVSGTVFAIGTDGNNFHPLYTFATGSVGAMACTLALCSNTLYGVTSPFNAYTSIGSTNLGTVFSINTDGSGYAVPYSFGPTLTNGVNPAGTLVVSGSEVFGITYSGGTGVYPGEGTVFSLTLPEPPTTPPFFTGEIALSVPGWYWLGPQDSDTFGFGYYSAAFAPFILHQDLGWEYYLDANNANHGAYFYDFTDGVWFYTEPGLFPYLYDFNQNAWMYLAPIDGTIDRYQSGPRWFYNTSTSKWVNDL